jgi:hypothetical protein
MPRAHSRGRPWCLATLSLLACGCIYSELDYEGKACPCPEPFDCVAGRCTLHGPGCTPRFQVENFRVEFTTPNTIRWGWDPLGAREDFSSYRLRVGSGSDPATAPDLRELGAIDNPELGYYELERTGERELVRFTTSDAHQPGTPYAGQLVAVDNTGCESLSPVVTPATAPAPPPDQVPIELFDEEVAAGLWMGPEGAVVVSDATRAHTGQNFLEWQVTTTSGENVQFQGYELSLDALGLNVERSAFIEFAVALESTNHSFWSRSGVGVIPPGGPPPYREGRLEGYTVRADDTYRVVQIPFYALAMDDSGPIIRSNERFDKFLFGCSPFVAGSVLRIDSVRIRW